jgi:hypothetical protein
MASSLYKGLSSKCPKDLLLLGVMLTTLMLTMAMVLGKFRLACLEERRGIFHAFSFYVQHVLYEYHLSNGN